MITLTAIPANRRTLIPEDEQRALVQKAQGGDINARNKLLIVSIGALLKTANRCQGEEVRRYIYDGLLPIVLACIKNYKHNRIPFVGYLMACLNLQRKTLLRGYMTHAQPLVSMDANQNNTGTTLHGILHETHIKYYGKEDIEPEDQDAKIDIEKAIKKLPERESKIVKKWMLGYSFREIGDELHITRERVRQFFNQAISMLEKKLNRKGYYHAVEITEGLQGTGMPEPG